MANLKLFLAITVFFYSRLSINHLLQSIKNLYFETKDIACILFCFFKHLVRNIVKYSQSSHRFIMSPKMIKVVIINCLLLLSFSGFAKTKIITVGPQSDTDSSHSYYIDLIKLALEKANKTDDYSIHFLKTVLSQGRTLVELSKRNSELNIYQTGTSVEREKKLIPIRIPLLKGTLGYRISLIHKDNIKKFDKISTLKQLSQLTACQGAHWPDSDILENAGLPVIRNSNYKSIFLQIKNKRCDYFPRAIIEAYSEAEAYNDPDIVVYDKLVIHYTFPMYFFVSPYNKVLARDIEKGLRLAVQDGSFDDLFHKNKITKHIFPLKKWESSTILHIKNPLLPRETPINNKMLWLTLD